MAHLNINRFKDILTMFLKSANAPWMNKRVKGYDVPNMNCELRGLIAERE